MRKGQTAMPSINAIQAKYKYISSTPHLLQCAVLSAQINTKQKVEEEKNQFPSILMIYVGVILFLSIILII